MQHLPGTSNVVADTLSRQEINAIFQHSVRVDWEGLAKAQLCDQQLLDFFLKQSLAQIKTSASSRNRFKTYL